ncbi:Kinesin-like protein KIN12B [Platanthera zijinensis]|uniref:Kinesin-like protein KIN12B n=1 Tax=Platanthera zijinensis TaxID=2320716 RepID=A0AAP0GB30_9ASPA
MRPLKKDEDDDGSQIVQKISANSISIFNHTFTFDSVADTGSTQHDIFQLVGVPLVENCLAWFNISIFAYGQTGSGKTYTMWGPSTSLTVNSSSNQERVLTPRVFKMLFSHIHEVAYNLCLILKSFDALIDAILWLCMECIEISIQEKNDEIVKLAKKIKLKCNLYTKQICSIRTLRI